MAWLIAFAKLLSVSGGAWRVFVDISLDELQQCAQLHCIAPLSFPSTHNCDYPAKFSASQKDTSASSSRQSRSLQWVGDLAQYTEVKKPFLRGGELAKDVFRLAID